MDPDDTIGRYNSTRYTVTTTRGSDILVQGTWIMITKKEDLFYTRQMDYDSEERQNNIRHRDIDYSLQRKNNRRHIDFEHSIRRQKGVSYNERRGLSYSRNNPTTYGKRQYDFSPNNRQYDYRRNVNSSY